MKKIIVVCLIFVLAIAGSLLLVGCGEEEKPLRLHIRADSNSAEDQAEKLRVRDCVVEYLTPLLAEAKDIDEAKEVFAAHASAIEILCEEVLRQDGFGYGADIRIGEEYFPSRSYGGRVYAAGTYDAVIINLGSGAGDNWWCVAYPPLCFGQDDGAVYRSAILDYFNSRRDNEK